MVHGIFSQRVLLSISNYLPILCSCWFWLMCYFCLELCPTVQTMVIVSIVVINSSKKGHCNILKYVGWALFCLFFLISWYSQTTYMKIYTVYPADSFVLKTFQWRFQHKYSVCFINKIMILMFQLSDIWCLTVSTYYFTSERSI